MNPSLPSVEQPEVATQTLVEAPKKARVLGVTELYDKTYPTLEVSEKVKAMIGSTISKPFTLLIYGLRKHGKTSFCMQLCKELAQNYQVFYNSFEEGDCLTMQEAIKRVNMHEVAGKFFLGDRLSFRQLMERLKKSRDQIVVLDSRDYMNLTTQQWVKLTGTFRRKSFILICWEQGGLPQGKYARDISYMVGAITHVKDFEAKTVGRYGNPEKPYRIAAKPKADYTGTLFENQ